MNKEEASGIINDLQIYLRRPLMKNESSIVISLYKKLYGTRNYISIIKEKFLNAIAKTDTNTSLREFKDNYMQEIIGTEAQKILCRSKDYSSYKTGKILRPETQKYVFLHLDSFYKVESVLNGFRMNFNDFTGNSGVSFVGDVLNINQLRLSAFNVPITSQFNNFYKTVYVEVEEFRSQSHKMPGVDRRYHFVCAVSIFSNYIRLIPQEDFYYYDFIKPFARPNTLTIRFHNPDIPILSIKDEFDVTWITNIPSTSVEFQTSISHNLTTADNVYFCNINLKASIDPNIQSEIEDLEGHSITVTSSNTFTIALTPSNITTVEWNNAHAIANLVPTVKSGANRIIMQLRMGFLN